MSRLLGALIAGLLFGAGLAFSGMADPPRVRAFLDIFGAWDPTLTFVTDGALVPMAMTWTVLPRIARAAFSDAFDLPTTRGIDAPLAVGTMLFGIGWGLSGLCPGPAIASLGLTPANAVAAVAEIIAGMLLHRMTQH